VYPLLPDFACNLEGYRKRNELKYDVIFSHYWLSAWLGEYLRQWWSVPNVNMFHTLAAVKNSFGVGRMEPELRIATEGELARDSQYIIAPTMREREELINQYGVTPGRIGVVPCGVNMGLFSPVDRDTAHRETGLGGDKIIIFAGRIDPLKGIANLIKVIPYLDNNGARLVIIGGGDGSREETAKLRALAGELGIENRVVFAGAVKQDRMPYYYSSADVCVIPSYYESFGLVALEALSCGTPVVANDVGDLKNIIRQGETGYVADGNEPRLLAEKINLLLDRSPGEMPPAAGIRESVIGFAWSNIAQDIASEFKRVLDNYCIPVT
jgi:D-inositol-3-phosphate glycosyltransferase